MIKLIIFTATEDGAELVKRCSKDSRFMTDVFILGTNQFKIRSASNTMLFSDEFDPVSVAARIASVRPDFVIDASPEDSEISKDIKLISKTSRVRYVRMIGSELKPEHSCIYADNAKHAVRIVNRNKGNVLLTTGTSELPVYSDISAMEQRAFIRLMPDEKAISAAVAVGFSRDNIAVDSPPYTLDSVSELIRKFNIKYLITSENAQDILIKEEACLVNNATLVVVKNAEEDGLTVEAVWSLITESAVKRNITIVGVGPGGSDYLCVGGAKAIEKCELLVGEERAIRSLELTGKEVKVFSSAREAYEQICSGEATDICVAFNGDITLCDEAKELRELLEELDVEVRCIQGVSSVSYLASRLNISWDGIKVAGSSLSVEDMVTAASENRQLFILPEDGRILNDFFKSLVRNGLEKLRICVGSNLTYDDEKIVSGYPEELIKVKFPTLSTVYIENNSFGKPLSIGLNDKEFIRGESVSMLTSEVRACVISKLELKSGSIVYAVGAGTGSVAVEVGFQLDHGIVYALEQRPSSLNILYSNIHKFNLHNVKVIEGDAKDTMLALPAPDAVYIGGTGGSLKRIIKELMEKGKPMRIVATAHTLENVFDLMRVFKDFSLEGLQICQVSVTKGKILEDSTQLKNNDPVFIISGNNSDEAKIITED